MLLLLQSTFPLFTYLLADVEVDFWGRGLLALPRADRFPVQPSCVLLSPSDDEPTAP